MNTSTAGPRRTRLKYSARNVMNAAFWDYSASQYLLKESERLLQIKNGFPAYLFQAVRGTFELRERSFKTLFNVSVSTLQRRRREQKPLDPVASERLDRIFAVCHLAQEVFDSREAAAKWLAKPNKSLGPSAPILLCETEIGATQVRRVLQAIEWGGAA